MRADQETTAEQGSRLPREGERTDTERSEAVVKALGYRVIPLAGPIGVWSVLAVDGRRGIVLVSTCRDNFPADLGRFGAPHAFPPWTKRLIHLWTPGEALPKVLSLGEP